MKFYCCGLTYSTQDPETYWCIETYILKRPVDAFIGNKKIVKQIIYTLFCKKNGCTKLELHSFAHVNGTLKLVCTQAMKGKGARAFLERTKDMRIRQPQCCPLKKVQYSKKIPWVYGKTIDSQTQVARYIDESGNRQVFKGDIWQTEIINSKIISNLKHT